MNGKRKWMKQICTGFLILMIGCTILSRAAASVLVPQVETKKPGRGRLTYSYEGKGTVVPVQENSLFLWPEQQVEWAVKQGTLVKAGECLVQFRMEYLEQAIAKKQAELNQLELQTAQQRLSAMEPARVPLTQGASQILEEAEECLQEAVQREIQAQAAYDQFLSDQTKSGLSVNSSDENQKNIEGEETGQAAENPAGGSLNQQENGNALRQQELETALQQARENTEAARQSVNRARNAYELAEQEDAVQDTNAANAAQAASLGVQSMEVQVEQVRRELEKLQSYQTAGGRICAEQDGIILKVDVQPGAVTTGCERIVTGNGGWRLKGMVSEADKEKLKAGADAEVRLGTGRKKTVKILSIGTETQTAAGANAAGEESVSPDSQTCWYAALPDQTEVKGEESFTWNIENPSEKEYEQTIPLRALREDVDGAYCLILAQEEGMLGTIQTAKRVAVTVLEKDAANAAVTSSLQETDQVIVSSEKYVEEGDRVR